MLCVHVFLSCVNINVPLFADVLDYVCMYIIQILCLSLCIFLSFVKHTVFYIKQVNLLHG